jgi:hypothetical protein
LPNLSSDRFVLWAASTCRKAETRLSGAFFRRARQDSNL